MRYLVDTDWVADYLSGRRKGVALLSRLFPEGLALSIVTYAEVYEGIYFGSNASAHEAGFTDLLTGVRVLGITRPVARRFAHLRGALRAKGQLIPEADLLIAATALHNNLTLVSRNIRHFRRVPELVLLPPPPEE